MDRKRRKRRKRRKKSEIIEESNEEERSNYGRTKFQRVGGKRRGKLSEPT